MSQIAIAEMLDMSKSRVSQLLSAGTRQNEPSWAQAP
jgi:DNA-directed RNA polymerase specialized sigma subunit